jgi:hypothetical protein
VAPIASRLLLEAKECQSISIIDEGITTDTLELSPQTETERLHFKFGADLITARSKTEVEELESPFVRPPSNSGHPAYSAS